MEPRQVSLEATQGPLVVPLTPMEASLPLDTRVLQGPASLLSTDLQDILEPREVPGPALRWCPFLRDKQPLGWFLRE